MSSMHRTIQGDVLVRHLVRDEWMIDQQLVARHGRSGRTLVKEGPLRLTLMALDAGGNLPMHGTTGPVTVHMSRASSSSTPWVGATCCRRDTASRWRQASPTVRRRRLAASSC